MLPQQLAIAGLKRINRVIVRQDKDDAMGDGQGRDS